MACKFKFGDRVRIGKHLGSIVSIRLITHTSEYICTVRFDNTLLIPSEMEYKESELQFEDNKTGGCPICRTPWHQSAFGKNIWKDCLKCNKKEEDILKIQKSNREYDTIDDEDDFTYY